MTPLLRRASLRHLGRHRGQTALAVLGVALAVALVAGIDLANHSADRAFRDSVERVAGRATHQIEGGPGGLAESVYRHLRVDLGMRRSAPVVEGTVVVTTDDATPPSAIPLRLLGIDPFAEAPVRAITANAILGDVADFLTLPGAVVLGSPLAQRLGVGMGEAVVVRVDGAPATAPNYRLTVVGLVDPVDERERQLLDDLVVADLSTAQEVMGLPGTLTRIDLVLDNDPSGDDPSDAAAALRRALPGGISLVARAERAGSLAQMTRAFRLNLTALSLLALVVGGFLIYNASAFSVVRRRRVLGILRAMGVTRREVVALVLGEALLIGAIGTVLGLLLGRVLADTLLTLVTRTINDLYAPMNETGVTIAPWTLIKSVGLGLGASLVAAWFPAREAANVAPRAATLRSDVERRARQGARRLAWLGAGLLLASIVLLLVPGRSLVIAFAGVLLLVLGYAALVPAATATLLYGAAPLLRRVFGVLGGMAARDAARSLSRTGVATAALVIAVAVTVGISIMIGSFRATLIDWLGVTLQADVYVVRTGAIERGNRSPLDPDVVSRLSNAPNVAHATTYQRAEVASPTGNVQVLALGGGAQSLAIFRLAAGDRDTATHQLETGDAVLVSEPFAFHQRRGVGDTIRLRTRHGERDFPIAGVFYDYGSDRGVVLMSRRSYERWWNDDTIHSLGLFAVEGHADSLHEALAPLVQVADGVRLIPNRALRETSLAIFDRTFAVTSILRFLAMMIAFVGVLSALLALQLERARELAVLRVNGLTPRQLGFLVTGQTGLLGLAAGLLAAPLGIAMAVVLVRVINRRSFGWTLLMEISPSVILSSVAMAVAAAMMAGLIPIRRLTAREPAAALREE